MEPKLSEKYASRAFRFLRLIEPGGWRIKLYGIRYRGDKVDGALLNAALPLLEARLAQSSGSVDHYSVGFAAVHQGKVGNFAFIDWWANENELHHHLYASRSERPTEFAYLTPTGVIACAWDLWLLAFEREAWVSAVLSNPKGPDLDAYIARRLEEDA